MRMGVFINPVNSGKNNICILYVLRSVCKYRLKTLADDLTQRNPTRALESLSETHLCATSLGQGVRITLGRVGETA